MFEVCKDTFPKEATIECIENRLTGIDVKIMATPCDGILECRDGRDENCEEDKLILATVIAMLFVTTILIYLFLIFAKLPTWKKSMLRDFIAVDSDNVCISSSCTDMKGNELARLKVSLAIRADAFSSLMLRFFFSIYVLTYCKFFSE